MFPIEISKTLISLVSPQILKFCLFYTFGVSELQREITVFQSDWRSFLISTLKWLRTDSSQMTPWMPFFLLGDISKSSSFLISILIKSVKFCFGTTWFSITTFPPQLILLLYCLERVIKSYDPWFNAYSWSIKIKNLNKAPLININYDHRKVIAKCK